MDRGPFNKLAGSLVTGHFTGQSVVSIVHTDMRVVTSGLAYSYNVTMSCDIAADS